MAMYRCSRCEAFVDNDYHPCEEDPAVEHGLICPSCAEDVPETLQVKQRGTFTKDQLDIIKLMENQDDDS